MSTTASPPPMLRLPPEILEKVFEFMVPCGDERYWDSIEPIPGHVIRWLKGWKDRCSAARLACRSFSQSLTLKRALFHTVYWFPTNDSLERLRAITENCPDMVRCFTWYGPMFGYEQIDEDIYRRQLHGETEGDIKVKLQDVTLSEAERKRLCKLLCKLLESGSLPMTDNDVDTGFAILQAAQNHQAFILQSEHTTIKLCQSFASLPNLTRFYYNCIPTKSFNDWSASERAFDWSTCARVYAIPHDLAAPSRSDLLSRWYPNVLIRQPHWGNRPFDPHVGAYSKIVNAMWARGIKPHSFSMAPHTGARCTKGTYMQIPNAYEMRHLGIALEDEEANAKIMKALNRNGRLLRNLESLCLGGTSGGLISENIATCMRTLLPLLPKLNKLWLMQFDFDAPHHLLDAFENMSSLHTLRLQQICVPAFRAWEDTDNSSWQRLFELLRTRAIFHFEFRHLQTTDHGDYVVNHFTVGLEAEIVRRKAQLDAFIKGTGDWTAELQDEFDESKMPDHSDGESQV